MIVDLRSDTVTKPGFAMRDAMMSAPVGDDVYGEDPSVNALQELAATRFGVEAALFCPSGTMTNQIAINVHALPGDEVMCDRFAHIYRYEAGSIARLTGASVQLLEGDHGRFTADQVNAAINPDDPHYPRTRVVSAENTMNKGGGSIWDLSVLESISGICQARGLAFHLDGARLFNALVETGESPQAYGRLFDSISICLSKGLGAPVGSLLLGSRDFIGRAKRVRKALGGGMRQAGMLAAAGIYALEHNIDRLKDDHRRARSLGKTLAGLSWVGEVLPAQTNIVICKVRAGLSEGAVIAGLRESGVLASAFGPGLVRFVTHLDLDDTGLELATAALRRLSP